MKIDFFTDSDRVQLNFPHQECERDREWKGLVPTTQPPMSPIPAVFPTSRTFFFSPSARMSGHRVNDSQAGAPRSSLRNRAKSVFTRPSKERALVESIVNHPRSSLKSQTFTPEHSYRNQQQQQPSLRSSAFRELCSGRSQQKQSTGSFLPSSPHPEASLMRFPPYKSDETTFSSPTYLHGLLESPGRTCKDPKPIKYIKIHYGPSHPSSPKQQPLRTRIVNIRSSNNDSFQRCEQEISNGFDYRKYLRSKRRNRINDQEQRVTLVTTLSDETIFVRGSSAYRACRPTTTLCNVSNSINS